MGYFLIQLERCFIYFAVLGIASHIFGELLPRDRFHFDRHPYAPYDWEQNGNFYNKKLHIRKWRHLLPDKSQTMKSMYTKKLCNNFSSPHVCRLLQETCVAEFVHGALILCSPFVMLFSDGKTTVFCMMLFMLGNVPFIMIQRYNRPKLARLYRAALEREEKARALGEEEQHDSNEEVDAVC